jgi:hypothetical protein
VSESNASWHLRGALKRRSRRWRRRQVLGFYIGNLIILLLTLGGGHRTFRNSLFVMSRGRMHRSVAMVPPSAARRGKSRRPRPSRIQSKFRPALSHGASGNTAPVPALWLAAGPNSRRAPGAVQATGDLHRVPASTASAAVFRSGVLDRLPLDASGRLERDAERQPGTDLLAHGVRHLLAEGGRDVD